MVTEYATEIGHWEEWQKAYRFGVILIFPPDVPAIEVNKMREVLDPQGQSYCSAHISLTIPLPRPMEEYHLEEVRKIAAGIQPFMIRYGPLSNYMPNPGIVLSIEPKDTLGELVTSLESTSVFDEAPPRPYPFSPHLTIAEFISGKRTLELMEELHGKTPEGEFLCDQVSYAVPDGNMHFTERVSIPLA